MLQLRSTKGDVLCGQRVKRLTVAGVALALMGGLGVVAHADTVIYDHFDNVGAGNSLDGRLAIVSNGNQWVGQTVAFKGNGAGGVSASTAAGYNRTVSIDLGSGFLGSNLGVYDLSLDMRHPAGGDSTSLSWVALGFMKDSRGACLKEEPRCSHASCRVSRRPPTLRPRPASGLP